MQDARWTTHDAGSGIRQRSKAQRRYRGFGLVALMPMLTQAALASVAPATPDAVETTVRVYPTAVVNAEQVTLADIAALAGQGADLAASWPVAKAPAPGQEITLDLDSIQRALIAKGINPSMWVFRGASRCKVSRPIVQRGQVPPVETNETPARLVSGSNFNAPGVPGVPGESATAAPPGPDADTLEGVIHKHITDRLSALGGRPSIQLSPALKDLLHLSRPAYEFSVADRSDRLLGLVPFDVTISRDGKAEQVRSILAEVALVKPVVVAAGPINRGQTIRADHVTLKEQTFDRPERAGMSDPAAIVGQRALRFINVGELVTGKDIEPVPLITRNDLVSVTTQRGGITIKSVARALASAGYGETVPLRNEASKQTFVARVTGLKTAEMAAIQIAPANLTMIGGPE